MHKDPTWPDGGITRIGLGPIVAALQSAITGKITLIGKPEINFFETALTRASYQRSNTIMIGDSPLTDISGAMSAGLKTLQVRTGNGTSASSKGCDWIVDSIADLPQWYESNFNHYRTIENAPRPNGFNRGDPNKDRPDNYVQGSTQSVR